MKFIRTISQTAVIQVISVLFEFITSVILVRNLGPLNYGVYTAVFIIPNLITGLGAMGIGPSIIYFSGRKIFNLWAIFYFSLIVGTLLSTLYLGLFYLLVDPIQKYIFTERIDVLLILMASLMIPLNLFNKFFRAILRGLGMVNAFTLTTILLPTISRFTLVLIFVIFLDYGVIGAISAPILSVFISSLAVIFMVILYIPSDMKKNVLMSFDQIMELMNYGLKSWLGSAIKKSDSGIMLLLVTYLTSLENLAYFKLGHTLANMSVKAKSIIDIVSVSKIVTSDTELIKAQFPRLFRSIAFLIVILTVIGNLLISPTIYIIYGEEFSETINVFRILLPGLLLLQFISVANQVKAYTGDPLHVSKVRIFGFVTNIVLLLTLVPYFSIYGAASSILIANTIMFLVSIYYSKKFFNIASYDLLVINQNDLRFFKSSISKQFSSKKN